MLYQCWLYNRAVYQLGERSGSYFICPYDGWEPQEAVSDENIPAILSHLESLYEEATEACSSQPLYRKAIAKLLHSFSDAFSEGDSDQRLTLMKYFIPVKAMSKPIKQAQDIWGGERSQGQQARSKIGISKVLLSLHMELSCCTREKEKCQPEVLY